MPERYGLCVVLYDQENYQASDLRCCSDISVPVSGMARTSFSAIDEALHVCRCMLARRRGRSRGLITEGNKCR